MSQFKLVLHSGRNTIDYVAFLLQVKCTGEFCALEEYIVTFDVGFGMLDLQICGVLTVNKK